MATIIGNKNSLLSLHGDVQVDKCIEAIEYMSETKTIDINKVNSTSESGGIYITETGRILDTFDKVDEDRAKYKIVPTGFRLKYTEYPLFASFIKLNTMWEGAFIGTGTQLFKMYEEHCPAKMTFDKSYITFFNEQNRTKDITGFGLKSLLQKKEDAVESDTEAVYTDPDNSSDAANNLAKAIEKCMKQAEGSKNKAVRKKNLTKAQRLQAHLNKMKKNNEKKKENISNNKNTVTKEETTNKEIENNNEDIKWAEVKAIEDAEEFFIDTITKEMNERVNEFINNDDAYYDAIDDTEIKSLVPDDKEIEREHIINTVTTDADELVRLMDPDYNGGNYEKQKYKNQLKSDLILDIYERLLIKEKWMYNSKPRLGFYLRGIFIIIQYQREKTGNQLRGNGYNYSEDKTKCVINTGLIDKYGNDIYIIDHTPEIPDFYDKKLNIMTTKSSLLEFGFSIYNTKNLPEPVKFVDNITQLMFDASLEDFDLNDDAHLKHIIDERKYRFPKKYQSETYTFLCDKLKSAIKQAIKISRTDYKYVVPKYDFYRNTIQFLIPLYLDKTPDDVPELVIVAGKQNELWKIYTVLYTDDAYDDARLICRQNDNWLKDLGENKQ